MQVYSKRYYKRVLGFFIPTVILLGSILVYRNKKTDEIELNYHFNGMVDSVSYDVKGKATVKIKKVNYDLSSPNWDFDHNRIQKGDSLIKEKNSMIIKLIRPTGQIIIEGEN